MRRIKEKSQVLGKVCESIGPKVEYPGSVHLDFFRRQVSQWILASSRFEAHVLLGLIKRDFKKATTYSSEALLSHIITTGICLEIEMLLILY